MKTATRIAATTAALAAAAAGGSAHAAIYTGSWDPAYGQPFPNLGWRGQATYFVPDACLALGDGDVANSNPCSNGAMRVLNATVVFYDLAAPATTVETLFFGNSLRITSVSVANHGLAGADTPFSPVIRASSSIAGGGSYFFALRFDDATASLSWLTELDPAGKPNYHLSVTPPPPIVFVVGSVPEPGTWALLASGLGIIGLALRRRGGGS